MRTVSEHGMMDSYDCGFAPGFFDQTFKFIKKPASASDLTIIIDGREFIPFGQVPFRVYDDHFYRIIYLNFKDRTAVFGKKTVLAQDIFYIILLPF